MNNPKPNIEFYRQRTFSEKMNATFDFIRENWKPLLKYSFYLIMPICLVQTFAMNSFLGTYMDAIMSSRGGQTPFGSSMVGFLTNYGILLLCFIVGSAVMSGMIYAMMQTYATRENRLRDITLDDFRDNLTKNAWKCLRIIFALLFAYLLVVFALAFLAVASKYTLIITIPLFIVFLICLIPLMMLIPVYIFERDIPFFDAIKKAWKLGTSTLGGMLGLMIVLYIISSVIQTITMMPWYLVWIFGTVFSLSSDAMITQSVIYKFSLYVLGLLQAFGMYISAIIGIVGLAFQYFHAREKVEGVTIESNISNFDEL